MPISDRRTVHPRPPASPAAEPGSPARASAASEPAAPHVAPLASPPSPAALASLLRRPSAEAPRAGGPRGAVLGDGVLLRGGRLLLEGAPVVVRASLKRSGGAQLLVAAARVIVDNGGTGAIAKLSASARRELVSELLPLLAGSSANHASTGASRALRASLGDVRARSGAFALLEECALSMRAPSEDRATQALAHALIAAAAREPHAGLRAHMQRRLGQLPARIAQGSLGPIVQELRAKHAHERPLRQEWLKGTPPTLKVLASVQDEFWREELAHYRERGYQVVEGPVGQAKASKTINNVVMDVQLRRRDGDVLDAMATRDVDIVLYSGHANLGGVSKIALEHAPATAAGDKLVALLACRSKQNVDAVSRHFPGQHLLVSAEGTYGHDDRIVTHALLEGVAHDRSYAQIEMAAKREGLWVSKNYYFPNESVALVGQERVFVPECKTASASSISMRAKVDPPAAATHAAGPVADAVAWLNTIQGYWAEAFGTRADKQLHDSLVPGGWFDGGKTGPMVKLDDVKVGGKSVVRVSVNAAYAHQDKDALGMMVSFAAGKELAARGDPKRSEHDKRMLALAMTASYCYYLVEFSDVADVLLRQFAKTFGFPPGLSWPVVEKAINADAKNDCSPKTIAALERGMEHMFLEVNPARTSSAFRRRVGAALEVLKDSGTKIGALTYEAIVTGQVLVDEIDDLSRGDYQHIRREYLKDGVTLPKDGHKQLGDHRSRVWRAITTTIDGYMWDNRVYIAPRLGAKELAATLVHEVNHVLNQSERHYRTPQAIFIEEYRAFYAEALFAGHKPDAAECRRIKEGVIHDYALKDVSPNDVADVPPGILEVRV